MPAPEKVECRNGCGTLVFFHEKWKSKTGKPVPIEEKPDGGWQRHNCPKAPKKTSSKPSMDTKKLEKRITALEQRIYNLEEIVASQQDVS